MTSIPWFTCLRYRLLAPDFEYEGRGGEGKTHTPGNLFDYQAGNTGDSHAAGTIALVEAMVFAASNPVSASAVADVLIAQKLVPDDVIDKVAYAERALKHLQQHYMSRGVRLVEAGRGWQFRTAEELAPALTRVIERPRRLSRPAMETLAIIAYHQPCTRAEIEQIRGVTLSQQILDTLVEAALVTPKGHKEVPGRPVLWATTESFLVRFGLVSLADLPRREELLVDLPLMSQDKADDIDSVEITNLIKDNEGQDA